ITAAERDILFGEARKFDRWAEPQPVFAPRAVRRVQPDGQRPGDDFERRATWADILMPQGWVPVGCRGEVEDWCRPGKDGGVSATVNYAASGLLYAFSTNAHPFEDGRGYSKFAAYALLRHGGDYAKAARALAEEGYGGTVLSAGRRVASGDVLTTILGTDK